MPGRVRAVRARLDPIRGRGRVPLSKRRTPGKPQFRDTDKLTLSALEEEIADAVLDAMLSIPYESLLDSVES